MKKSVILVIIVLALSTQIYAGEITDIGMRIGYVSSVFNGKDLPGKGVQQVPGFTIGGFAQYELNRKFSIQPEILLTTKGSKINTVGDIEQYNIFIYVEMPVLAKYYLVRSNSFRISGLLGPYCGLKALAMNDVGMLDNI